MASYEQVVKLENEKPDGVIRLVESSGFYRAYNKSAFLFHRVIAQHKVTRKFAKNINQEIVYVGFPVDRFLDRVGGRSHKKTEFGYDVALAEGECPDMDEYEAWLKTVPTEPASRSEAAALPRGGEELRRAVCERIMTWPMESKSLIESVAFLAELKKALGRETIE